MVTEENVGGEIMYRVGRNLLTAEEYLDMTMGILVNCPQKPIEIFDDGQNIDAQVEVEEPDPYSEEQN